MAFRGGLLHFFWSLNGIMHNTKHGTVLHNTIHACAFLSIKSQNVCCEKDLLFLLCVCINLSMIFVYRPQ